MQLQITIRDMPSSGALEEHIRNKATGLNRYYRQIHSCHVVVELSQKHKKKGKLFAVHIDLTVPRKELAVTRKYDEDVYVALRDAFKAAARVLDDYADIQRGSVKKHDIATEGRVERLMPEGGFGFIRGADGNEYYFSITNMASTVFEHLHRGDIVHFLGVQESDGMQAHRVTKDHI